MSSLLALPHELRDDIIKYVLLARRLQWNDTTLAETIVPYDEKVKKKKRIRLPELQPFQCNATALLLSCKALNAQTTDVANRLFAPRTATRKAKLAPDYALDALVVYESDFVTTWTQLPVLSDTIETLTVDVRHHGTAFAKGVSPGHWRLSGFPPMPYLLGCFANLVTSVLMHGPADRSPGERHERPRKLEPLHRISSIQTVRFNLVTPAPITPAPGWKERVAEFQAHPEAYDFPVIQWREDGMVDPEQVLSTISQFLLWEVEHHQFEWTGGRSAGFLQQVGSIQFCLDGVTQSHRDLNPLLAELERGRMTKLSEDEFEKRRKEVQAHREELGLS